MRYDCSYQDGRAGSGPGYALPGSPVPSGCAGPTGHLEMKAPSLKKLPEDSFWFSILETKLIFKTFLQNGTGVTRAAGVAQKYPRSEVFCFTEIKTFQTSKNIPNFETGLQAYFLPLLKERKTNTPVHRKAETDRERS